MCSLHVLDIAREKSKIEIVKGKTQKVTDVYVATWKWDAFL